MSICLFIAFVFRITICCLIKTLKYNWWSSLGKGHLSICIANVLIFTHHVSLKTWEDPSDSLLPWQCQSVTTPGTKISQYCDSMRAKYKPPQLRPDVRCIRRMHSHNWMPQDSVYIMILFVCDDKEAFMHLYPRKFI